MSTAHVPPHHPDPGSGQRFRVVLPAGKLKKVWRFLQRIVSNGLALKTAVLRDDELKKFPHACKPETKNPMAVRASVGNFIGINFRGLFSFAHGHPTRMTFFDDSVTDENAHKDYLGRGSSSE